ncbi:hypothetical protein BEN47_10230 [Hymenobacter lapidarius]|uniref:Secretion system C-terminal sorting domain-containing protein n=1 Tax=Hymenobacter lapidarius TaxID=1908237 RepID=A0A1G1TAL9_9BACT|nr:hypothetical protein BEN47_10230 [Hymenobacter lapidarius]
MAAHAQAAPVVTPAPAATAPAVPESGQEAILPTGVVNAPVVAAAAPAATTALASSTRIAPAPETPAANPNAIKVKAEAAAGRLTVKTDNPGPTRIEVTDGSGRPVLTRTMMNGQAATVLNVSQLPPGSYIVRCTAYEKTGMRQVRIGQ